MNRNKIIALVWFILSLVWLLTTSQIASAAPPSQSDPAYTLFTQALKKVDAEAYEEAISLLRQLLDQYPDSEWADEGAMSLIGIYVLLEQQEQAFLEAQTFLEEYPHSEYAELASQLVSSYEIDRALANDPCSESMQSATALYQQSLYVEALEQFQIALTCYHEADDPFGEIWMLQWIGFIQETLDHNDEALATYEQALTISREIDSQAAEATILTDIAEFYYNQARYDEALAILEEALIIDRELGKYAEEGAIFYNIGRVYDDQNRYKDALAAYIQSLAITRDVGDPANEARILDEIARIYIDLSRYSEALEASQQALKIHEGLGNQTSDVALVNIGEVYRLQGRYDESLERFQQALIIVRESGDRNKGGTILNHIGTVYLGLGRYQEALEAIDQALAIHREVEYLIGESVSYHNIGMLYQNQGRYHQALTAYQQALAVHRRADNRAEEAFTLSSIGGLYIEQGRYQEALATLEQALAIARKVDNRALEGVVLGNLGWVYQGQGRYQEALTAHQRALAIHREVGDRANEAATLNSIGRVYQVQGHYGEALENYQQAMAILNDLGSLPRAGVVLNNIGLIYIDQGRYEEALTVFLQIFDDLKETDDQAGKAALVNNIWSLLQAPVNHDSALIAFEQALAVARETDDRAGEAIYLSNIGVVYQNQERYAEALEAYEQALAINHEVGDPALKAVLLSNIGGLYRDQGRYSEALTAYEHALAISREIVHRVLQVTVMRDIGSIYETQKRYDEALNYYQQATDVFEAIRTVAGSEEGRATFSAQHADLYIRTVRLFHQQDQDEDAFFTSEQGRARAFLDSLATGYVQLSDNEAADLLAQEQAAYAQRQATIDALAKARTLDSPDPDLVADLETQLAEAEASYEEALTAIEARGDHLATLARGRSTSKTLLSVSKVQASLDEQTTLISFFVLEDETMAFLITRDSIQTVILDVSREELNAQIRAFRDFPSLDTAYPDSAITLYGWLIEPIKEHLNTPHLVIIPHQSLHYLPFAALTDGEQYLIDDYVLTTLPSASALPFIQDNTGREPINPLILGNPVTGDFDITASFGAERDGLGSLPFAEQEAKAIAALYGVEPLLGKEATEGEVRERAGRAGILHLAAHSFYNPVAPLSSLIALAPDNDNDGWLTVGEVYGLDLSQADLVVLSACQTNLGELSEGDELVGLTRAFIFAGTPTVVASLWSVEDESTALLMERFYTYLREGMGKAEALRQAQLEVREEYPNPYYWAGFVLSGDGGEVGDVQPTVIEEAGKIEEADAAGTQSPSVALKATSPPSEPVVGEQESQSVEEATPAWGWPILVGGLLVIVLLGGGAIVWRRMRRTSRGESVQ